MSNKSVLLSIVIPCFNEAPVIGETYRRLKMLSAQLVDIETELIFVDDGSQDSTRELLRHFAIEDKQVRVIGFARNFGHQIAVSAGINIAKGNAVVLIDADLQDPPEVILQMIEKWREGYDVIYGVRTERPGESTFKLSTSRAFYRILDRLSDVPIPRDTGDFRLMSRRVVDVIRDMPERNRFIRGMVSWVGFRQVPLHYRREERFAGVTKYPLKKMLRFAKDGILSFSSKPLQLATRLGMFSAIFSLLITVYAVILRLFTDIWVPGWTILIVSVTFFGGVQLVCVGILGEYIGRIYDQVRQRPLYVVDEKIGFGNDNDTVE